MTKISKKICVFVCALLVAFSCVFVPKFVKADNVIENNSITDLTNSFVYFDKSITPPPLNAEFNVNFKLYEWRESEQIWVEKPVVCNKLIITTFNWYYNDTDLEHRIYSETQNFIYLRIFITGGSDVNNSTLIDYFSSNYTIVSVNTVYSLDLQRLFEYERDNVFSNQSYDFNAKFTTDSPYVVNQLSFNVSGSYKTCQFRYTEFGNTTLFSNTAYYYSYYNYRQLLNPFTLGGYVNYNVWFREKYNYFQMYVFDFGNLPVNLIEYCFRPNTLNNYNYNNYMLYNRYFNISSEFDTIKNNTYNIGFDNGYSNGYDDGVEYAQDFNLYKLVGSIFDGVMDIVRGVLDHDLFGFNVLNFLMGLVSIVIIVKVIQMVKGG